LCAGCAHSGAIDTKKGGKCQITIIEPLKEFKGTLNNEVQSQSKKSSGDFSLKFDPAGGKPFKPFPGMMVDVNDGNDKEAIVTAVKETTKKDNYIVTCKVTGIEDSVNFDWPGAKIDYCGAKLPDRDCAKKSLNPEESSKYKAQICFS